MSETDYQMGPAVDLANSWARECGLPEITNAAGLHALIGRLWDRQGSVSAAYSRTEAAKAVALAARHEALLAEVERLRAVATAARLMPRATLVGGSSGDVAAYTINNGAIWALDAALLRLESP